MKARFLSLLIVLLASYSCKFIENERKVKGVIDSFYTDLGETGRARIPLIKPYELIKVSSVEWRLELQNSNLLTLSIHNVKGVDVQDSLILIYSDGGTEFLNIHHKKAWFIFEPGSGIEKGFDNEEKFSEIFHKSRNRIKFHFNSPDSLYESFEENRKIKW